MTTSVTPTGRQAIVTKYHGPTNVKGSRVSATCEAGRVILEWESALNLEENHAAAVRALLKKLGWGGHWVSGYVPHIGYVWSDASSLLQDQLAMQ